ncbi:MAG: flagellar hook assembly protein FlgD [Spirochaetia bacterium]
MDFSAALSESQKSQVEMKVNAVNKEIGDGKEMQQDMGKDDFLNLLITQLKHQDPTDPMKDKEFIAQMAQFSSLEQMTNMASKFSDLAGVMDRGNALNLLGKHVEIREGDRVTRGVVEEVSGKERPQVRVDGRYFGYEQVETVTNKEAAQ